MQSVTRYIARPAVCAIVCQFVTICFAAHGSSVLVDRAVAERLGLKRAWFSQVELDSAYSQVNDWVLSYDELFVSTTTGLVHALDVQTGRTLWTARVGNPHYPTLGPTVSDRYVAVINGSTAYLLNRANGRVALEQRLDGAPGAPPVLAGKYFYTALLNGRVAGYPVDTKGDDVERTTSPWFYQSFGRAMVAPLATPDGLIWTTDRGYLYASGGEQPAIRYRLETPATFSTSAKLGADAVYAVSSRGELYALDTARGRQRWKYSAGFPAYRAPTVIGNEVFVASVEPALHCVDAVTGEIKWFARGVSQFAAATAGHVYGVDRFGSFYILDRRSGARLARVPTDDSLSAVANEQSDRLILITDRGLVQCFHELGADEPTYYVSRPGVTGEEPPAEAVEEPVAEAATDEEEAPAEGGLDAMDEQPQVGEPAEETDDENPFDFGDFGAENEGENPFGVGDDGENPFQ